MWCFCLVFCKIFLKILREFTNFQGIFYYLFFTFYHMDFYRQIFTNLENNTRPKNRQSSLIKHIQRHFPVLFQRYPDMIRGYTDGSVSYSQMLPLLVHIRSERILRIEEGTVRSRRYILGLPDSVMDEVRRFQEAFWSRWTLSSDRVPGTGIVQCATWDRVKNFLW